MRTSGGAAGTRTARSPGRAATATAPSAWSRSWRPGASPFWRRCGARWSVFNRRRGQGHKRVDFIGDIAAVVRTLKQNHAEHILAGIDPAVGAIRAAVTVGADRVQSKHAGGLAHHRPGESISHAGGKDAGN